MLKNNHISTLLGIFLLLNTCAFAQVDFYLTPGIGVAYTKARLGKLQDSYTSYQKFLDENFANDPYTADPNWNLSSVVPSYTLQAGMSIDGAMFGVAYIPHFLKQERNVMRDSGYGRRFTWKEQRHDVLFDIGWGNEKVDIYGSFGVNMNNYKMTSALIYPSGALSVTNEFDFNGVFRNFDAGYSLGAGVRVKPIKYLAIDLRYIFSSDKLPGENTSIGDEPALADNSFARTPGTSQYPQDYSQPLTLDNEVVPNFRRSYLQLTLHFYYRNND